MMDQEKPLLRTALVYDFDGTLAPGNIQEHSLIPNHLGLAPGDFWRLVHEVKRAEDADEVLVYLRLLLVKAAERSVKMTRAILQEHGAKTPLFEGVESWFGRIDEYAAQRGLQLEHYVISSGNQQRAYNLIAEDRAHFVVPADYKEGSQLDVTIKGVLGRIARDEAGYRELRTSGP